MTNDDALLTVSEAAHYLGMTRPSLYALRHRGDAPLGFRVGGRVLYRRAEIDAWLEARREHDDHQAAG